MAEPEKPEEPKPAEAEPAEEPKPAEAEPAEEPKPTEAEQTAAPAPGDPRMAQLRVAVDHFVAGNFAAARRTVSELLKGEVPDEIRKPAEELVHRLGLDPVALWVALGSTLLFIIVVVLTYRH
jgi:outer membrane biosynthesis protein TonB